MTAELMRLERDALLNWISAFTVAAARTMKTIIRKWTQTKWLVLFNIVAGAVLGVIAIKLLALLATAFDISFLRDVGNNGGPGAAAGGAGAGAGGGLGWPGGKDPYPYIGGPDDNPSGSSGTQGSGGTGGPSDGKGPWWQNFIPHTIPIALGAGLNIFSGRVEGPGFSAGAAPGSDPGGPIVNVNYGIPGAGSMGPHGTASVSINQQNVPLTGMGSRTPSGSQILNGSMSSDGTYNNTGN
jgi:hypothetical protein